MPNSSKYVDIYVVVEVVVEIVDDFYLLLYDLGKDPIFYCEEACHSGDVSLVNFGLYAHPQRHARHNLQYDTAQAPNIDDPWVFVLLHLLQHFLVVFQLVLEEDVVENFGRHVFGGSHGELFQVGEEEAASEIYEFHPSDKTDISRVLFSFCSQKDVLCLEIRMNNVVGVDEEERLADLYYENFQLVLVLYHTVDQLFINDLNERKITRQNRYPFEFYPFSQKRQLPNDYQQTQQQSQESTVLIQWEQSRQILFIPMWFQNYSLASPPFSKKQDPNQISFRWVQCGFLVRICLIATFLFDDLWTPSQTTLKPPLPRSPTLRKLSGNLQPNLVYQSAVRQLRTLKLYPSLFFSLTLIVSSSVYLLWLRGCLFCMLLPFSRWLAFSLLYSSRLRSNSCFKSSQVSSHVPQRPVLTNNSFPFASLAFDVFTSRYEVFLGQWKFLGVRLVRMCGRFESSLLGRLGSRYSEQCLGGGCGWLWFVLYTTFLIWCLICSLLMERLLFGEYSDFDFCLLQTDLSSLSLGDFWDFFIEESRYILTDYYFKIKRCDTG